MHFYLPPLEGNLIFKSGTNDHDKIQWLPVLIRHTNHWNVRSEIIISQQQQPNKKERKKRLRFDNRPLPSSQSPSIILQLKKFIKFSSECDYTCETSNENAREKGVGGGWETRINEPTIQGWTPVYHKGTTNFSSLLVKTKFSRRRTSSRSPFERATPDFIPEFLFSLKFFFLSSSCSATWF